MNSNLFWCIVGIIGGAIVSTIFYLASKKRKVISYKISTTTLISSKCSKLKKLKISYKNIEIDNLYVSTIKIKNIGNCIIENNDFAPSAPLSLKTDEIFLTTLTTQENSFTSSPLLSIITDNSFSITSKAESTDIDLDTTQVFSSDSYNQVFPIPQFNEQNICTTAKINFDYISKKEIITCTIFHTGSLSLIGKLKDGKITREDKSETFKFMHDIVKSCIIGLIATIIINIIMTSK